MRDRETQFSQLMRRPDIDQATGRYEEVYGRVRQRLSDVVPALADWKSGGDRGTAMCGTDFPDLGADGRIAMLGNWSAEAPIPDGDWARAIQAVDEVVRGYGFDSGPIAAADKPQNHYVAFYDQYRAALTISSGHSTDVLLITGCHLTSAARERVS
jgi:hypothetical protein